jgi:hypothetical protein
MFALHEQIPGFNAQYCRKRGKDKERKRERERQKDKQGGEEEKQIIKKNEGEILKLKA